MIINRTVPTVLVIASAATPREQFAAEELQRYLEKITGSKLPIVNDQTAVDGQQILIGGPARNRKAAELLDAAAFSAEVPGPEGFLIRSFGDDRILIAGSEDSAERGTVYGVYEFLGLCAHHLPLAGGLF